MTLAPFLLYQATKGTIRRVIAAGFDFDLIDAHYFYPDGVSAVLLGRYFKKPVVVTARGTDINLIPRYTLPRQMIRWAANNAAGLVTVCEALKRELANLGVEPERIRVLRNGVDLSVFRPVDRDSAREQLGIQGPTILSVGHLVPRKGHDLVIRALTDLVDVSLLVVGEGSERLSLESLAKELGVDDRVRFAGSIEHERMHEIYGAADALVLASDREGWANVLLESMACGTPVVASNVWGTPEIVRSPAAGLLLSNRNPQTIADSIKTLLQDPPARAETRAYAEGFDWSQTTQGQLDLFREILGMETAA
jgi:glycosyltransferase involved in cell wall biosynthesis